MIRRSAAIATAAILLSLSVHLLGLNFTWQGKPEESGEVAPADVVPLGNAFEDVADTLSEPVPPEPPVETLPAPDEFEATTSEALVASSDPQHDLAPDAPATAPTEPVEAQPAPSPPVSDAPQPEPSEQLAALPAPPAPSLPVTPVPEAAEVPVIPLEPEIVNPETPQVQSEAVPGFPATEDDLGTSDLAVVTSPRPRLPVRRPTVESTVPDDGSTEFSDLLSPPLMESPLATYQRDRVDRIIPQAGSGFLGSGGSGNSSTTNYAGRVLVHLNSAPVVRIAARGAAWVHFAINPDGTLARVDIIDSSGSLEIERAAKEQVRSASPFPRPPDGKRKTLTFVYRKY
jgi:TonB family protein